MSVEERLGDLLLRWEELQEQGQPVSPEELCRDCPELLGELRRRIRALQSLHWALAPGDCPPTGIDALAPTRTDSEREGGPPRAPAVPGYEIVGELGRGGMGVVYKARQLKLNRVVALKMILAGAHAGDRQRARFRAEAEAAARLAHPNIVQVYEVGDSGGCPYLSLEYVEGRNLNDVLFDSPPAPARAAELVEQLAHAVYYAHQKGVVHRDLKPGNVLLAQDGTPKVTDFGLAKLLDAGQARTRTGDVLGTPAYMAPEQAAGKRDVGPAADVYALGAILYEMLTGRPPFEGASDWEIVHRVISAEPVPPSRLQPGVPRDLETICLKCLEKEPARRYASARALADDLRWFRAGEPIQARPVGWLERAGKWVRRRPAVAALLGVSLASLLALLAGGWVAAAKLYRGNQALAAADREKHHALVRLNVLNGTHYLQDDDLFASLIWFARALKLEDEPRREAHRVRIAAVLRQCPRLGRLWFHDDSVTDVTFSPDGRWVLTASADQTARVWDASTGEARFAEPLRHDYFILAASFSPDGTRVVTASADRTARVWDASTGKPVGAPLPHDGAVVRASFHPDGRRVLTASADGSARVWRLGPAEVVARMRHAGPLTDACFDRDGGLVATASADGTARVWKAAAGEPLTDPLRHHGAVLRVTFRPDGRRLATASNDLTARVWDAQTGQPLVPVLMHASPVECVAFSPDGTRLVTGSDDNTARVWDAGNGRPLTPPLPHNGSLTRVCFSPDGRRIVTAAEDTTARVYELVPRPPPVPPLVHGAPLWQASFRPDGARVVTAGADATARVWDARTGEALAVLRGHKGAVFGATYSGDGRRIVTASADATARVWDASTGRPVLTLAGHKGPVRTAAFSPDGLRVLTASDDGTARVWDAATGRQTAELSGHEPHQRWEVLDAAFSPDGLRVATAGADRTARLWDPVTGKQVGRTMRHRRRVVRVCFSPDGRRLATASFDQTARLWDAATGEPLLPTPLRHPGPVRDVSFSPDGRRVVTASDDNTARVWDADSGEPVLPPLAHGGTVGKARFSGDGGRVVTASEDNTARVWDASTGDPLTPALRHGGWGGVRCAAFSPAGDRVVTASEDGTARVWELGRQDWPAEDLERLAELLDGSRIGPDRGSLVPLDAGEMRRLWDELRTRLPDAPG